MKIRNGFVSNSSSSSYLVVIPEKFDVKEFLNKKNIDIENLDFEVENIDELIEKINGYINEGKIWECENYEEFYWISDLFSDMVLTGFDVSSDSGTIIFKKDTEIINKIDKIKNGF